MSGLRVLQQGLLLFLGQLLIDLFQGSAMENPMADNGVPLVPGVERSVGASLEYLLDLLQRGVHADAQAQQPVPGGPPPAGKHLVEIHLAHARLPGQGCLGNRDSLVEPVQKASHVLIGEVRLVLGQIDVQVRLAHQPAAQIQGAAFFHNLSPLYFQF